LPVLGAFITSIDGRHDSSAQRRFLADQRSSQDAGKVYLASPLGGGGERHRGADRLPEEI
jgi:hypothetical protein